MTTYRASRNPADGKFRIREVPHEPPADRRKVSVGRVAENMNLPDLIKICLTLGIAAPSSTPVPIETAIPALAQRRIDCAQMDDAAAQRVYDLSQLRRTELAGIMECFFELHDLID